jgi:hypothetical protein
MARYRREHGEELDFNRAYWTAPLGFAEAHELERQHIEAALGLEGLVSLTDHDNIEGAMERNDAGAPAVVSLEWTVPFAPAYFHLGVHNLPRAQAREILSRLLAYTEAPDERQLPELFVLLDAIPDVLLVLNHPFWEMEPIGQPALLAMLNSFLRSYGPYIHAFEVSGLRPWQENQRVLEMANDLRVPIVSGGDRHGWEANAMLNLTGAATFSEFVAEVRQDGRSTIAVMPSYQKEPFGLRMMQVAWDVLRDYPGHPAGRVHWTDRVFFVCDDGVARPLARCFPAGEPQELRVLTGVMRQLEGQPWRALLHAAWSVHSTHQARPPHRPAVRPAARPVFNRRERSVA